MTRSAVRTLFLAFVVLAATPLALKAQSPEPTQQLPTEVPSDAGEWLAEIQEIHERLSTLQERALQDPELAARQDSLGNHIRVAMETIDPSLAESMSRIEEMERQAAEAEARNDEAKLTELRAEAQRIEEQFVSAQQQALQRPDLAAEFLEFQTLLEQKILAADPEAPRLLARFQELNEKLATLAQQGN